MEGDRRRRGATKDARLLHVDDKEPHLPLDKETMILILQPVLVVSLPFISMGNVAFSPNMDGSTNHPHITAILASLKYAYLPFGLAGLAASYAANTKTHLVGCGSGCLLGLFMYCFSVLGLIVAEPETNPWVLLVTGAVTLVVLVATVLGWSYVCSYPKFLRCIWTNAGRSQEQACPSCRAAETSVVSPTVEGFTDLCLACGASRGDVGIGPVKTSGDGDEAASTEERELVVTKPVIAHLITLSSVIFAVATIGTFVYIAYMHFKIDGPMWEAVVSCAAESPLLLMPLCMVPRLRDAFVSIYATGLPDSSRSDLNTRLLASEIV